MRVFKFYDGDRIYAYSGEDIMDAEKTLLEDVCEFEIENFEEIPENEWDEKNIKMYVDNDCTSEPYFVSIRDLIEDTSMLIFSNEMD